MKRQSAFVALVAICSLVLPASASAQSEQGAAAARDTARKVLTVAGTRAGPSIFPLVNYPETRPLVAGQLDWKHYHHSVEIEEFMRKWAREFPDLVELYVVGKAFSGRDVWQMTITNKKTGKDTEKPAAFFEGGRHSGEITSTESAFYLIWYLIDRYGKDTAITRLLDRKAIYIRPLNNPDGSDMYRLTAQANRSTVRPYDDDGDGLLDEDPGEDLDGDGYIRQMRKFVGAKKGSQIIDPADKSRRTMKSVGDSLGDYMTYSEGVDNDADGKYNEDGVGGLDLHRNYPANWRPSAESTGRGTTQAGAGEYPTSEPESRSVVLWTLTHPNIGVANSMDTSVPMHLRPPSTCEETECMYPSDLKWYRYFDTLGIKRTGYPWAGDVYRTYHTRGVVDPITGDTLQPQALFGHGPDYGYFHLGAIWYGDELWNGGRERDYNKDGRVDQYEVLRYCDEEYGGSCFAPWTKAQHPVLGAVEIGGYNPKFFSQNGPPQTIEKWARNQAMFNLDLAMALPQMELVGVTSSPISGVQKDSATHELRVSIRNSGLLPTALEQAKRVKIVRPDQIVGRFRPKGGSRLVGRQPTYWLEGGETKVVTVRVKVGSDPADRSFGIRASSTRGGLSAELPVKIE